ncbi:MAG: hypothetical protein RLP15_09425 [Cryomorphaceae bacterium]
MQRILPILLKACYFLITSLAIIAPALYNRYPLMYFDSGAYMEMAANLEPSFHRAFGYPLLIKWTGWLVSNWPLIFLQGVVLSYLIYKILQVVLGKRSILWEHTLSVLVLSFASAISWYAAQLMPDIWTLILILTLSLVLITKGLSLRRALVYGLLMTTALLTHLSHVPLMLLLLVSVFAIDRIGRPNRFGFSLRQYATAFLPLLAAFIITSSFNAVHGMGFRLSLASNAFVTANLGEMGILKFYLDERCESMDCNLCEIKDNLPKETYGYLWDPEGPVQQHPGGWEGANEAYAPIVHDFLTKPRYVKWLLFSAAKATVKQMFQIEIGSGLQYAYGEGTPPYWPMKSHYKQELNEYLTSVQNKGDDLPLDFFRWVNYLSLFLSLGIISWAVLRQKLSPELAVLLILFILAYVFNAAITGVLANVYERLQVRLLPCVQLMALLIAFQWHGTGRPKEVE